MLSVLHLIPTLEGGGAERQLSLLATEQAQRGLSVHVAARRGGVHLQRMIDGGVKFHELGNWPSANPRLFLAIRRALRTVKPHILQTWLPQMDLLGGVAATQYRIPWIVSERTSREYYAQIPAIAGLRLFVGRFAAAIIANSHAGADYWKEALSRPAKVAVVPNAIDFVGIRAASLEALSPARRPMLLCIGRFTHEKALEVIVRAAGRLTDQISVNIAMVGEGPQRTAIEAEIAAAGLGEVIMVLPYQANWWGWLKTVDGLISMSRFEGNPNVALEAMAGDCPVILSDIPAHREIADASSALFVPVDHVQSLSAAITELIQDKQGARRRAERACAKVSSMTIERMADAYGSIYDNVLSRTG
jgi:glycosyltransferase involved in cell wall biosynthesis